MAMKTDPPSGFDRPTSLPASEVQHKNWQDQNRTWWETHPMRYDWKDEIPFEEFSKDFYLQIDKRFFSNASEYMTYNKTSFDRLISLDELDGKDVLEIGVGNGSHAQLLAQYAKTYTGIDITDYAVRSTSRRMECFHLAGRIVRMDAENIKFDDGSFDFIWTWGVIHHSSNTEAILQEMRRVLRPGGTATVMVYHRSLWNYYIMNGLLRGIILGELFRAGSLHKTVQRSTDGAIARYYTLAEWKSLASKYFVIRTTKIYGSKAELIPLPGGKTKTFILGLLPNSVARFFTTQLRFGAFLVSTLEKK